MDNKPEALILDIEDDRILASRFLQRKQQEAIAEADDFDYTLDKIYFDFKQNLLNVIAEVGDTIELGVANSSALTQQDRELLALIRVSAEELGYIAAPYQVDPKNHHKISITLYEAFTAPTCTASVIDVFSVDDGRLKKCASKHASKDSVTS